MGRARQLRFDCRSPPSANARSLSLTRLRAALGEDLVKIYGWSNFDTTIDRLMEEQPKEWLPKEFSSYADLLRASYSDARAALTQSLGEDESRWKWGEMVKVRFQHPLAVVPLIGNQFAVPPFPQNGTSALAATVNVGAAVSMRLIADTAELGPDTTWHLAWSIRRTV